jgi:antitoxin (DNA-binding transcriptional repressor) of toxin-antitoxin stability system
MTPDELESLINEAVAAARTASPARFIDEADVQAQWDSLLDEVGRGSRYIITREGRAGAVMIAVPAAAGRTTDQSEPKDLASAISQRFPPFGGVDDLETASRGAGRGTPIL